MFKNNNSGFTLVELMVSITIIAVLSTVSIANFYSYKKNNDINAAALKLASDIRKTQNYALGLKEFGGRFPWGIYFNTTNPGHYIIFSDSNNNNYYNNGESFSDISFPDSTTISNIIFDGSSVNRVAAVFVAPDPEVYLCQNQSQCVTPKIEIVLTKGNITKTVSVNNLGLVEVY